MQVLASDRLLVKDTAITIKDIATTINYMAMIVEGFNEEMCDSLFPNNDILTDYVKKGNPITMLLEHPYCIKPVFAWTDELLDEIFLEKIEPILFLVDKCIDKTNIHVSYLNQYSDLFYIKW